MSQAPEDSATAETLAAKIPDGDLRRLAESPSKDSASVIIELELPRRQVEFAEPRRGDRRPSLPLGVAPATDDEREAVERATNEAMRFLRELLGEDPVHLRSARAIAVNVRGQHLHAIARQPWARCIRRNRPLR